MPDTRSQPGTGTRLSPAPTGILRLVLTALLTWSARSKDRAHLARLDPHLIRDIGIDPRHAAEESAKPFWRG